jgi:hypothetical protein
MPRDERGCAFVPLHPKSVRVDLCGDATEPDLLSLMPLVAYSSGSRGRGADRGADRADDATVINSSW